MEGQEMCVRDRLNKPAGLIPVATMCLIVGLLWPHLFHPTTNSWKQWGDGLRGLLLGVYIGINLIAVRLARRQRRCGGSSAVARDRDLQDPTIQT
jgi:hypothetical protein